VTEKLDLRILNTRQLCWFIKKVEFKFCVFIDRRRVGGITDFTDLPFDNLAKL